jgi:hypothetical protein
LIENDNIVILLSTQSLIKNYINGKKNFIKEAILYLDTTYKLSMDGYKVTILGNHDK